MSKDYSASLNLPNTPFAMRAELPKREPQMLDYWNGLGLYAKMEEHRAGKPLFVLHDGPPFSNGNIHMGTAMNKILKDFINKSKNMAGFRTPYIPGWDNHGMPIESAIIKKNKLDRKRMSVPEFRSQCHQFAENFVDIQRGQFRRLGVTADWEHPYLTMSPDFEAREVKVFGEMYRKGYIYKGLKPVYWCPKDETALAEAEIEYQTDPCTSIYVKFRVKEDGGKLSDVCDLPKTYFIIWTTTTWTLPGNLAIALNPEEDYSVVRAANGEFYITAKALTDRTMAAGGIGEYREVAVLKGRDFEFMKAAHPFLDRDSVLVCADYVTMDSGTGCVHTAPGFGADDYQTCRRYNMEIIVPVDDRGYQTKDAGKFAGMYYADSNAAILADLKESGALFASEEISHEYPHCWRCKSPIIFRATPQWFCSVDAFKEEAAAACDRVQWLPEWGGERIKSMVRERADWCISRQRHWGLPIPVFYCADCGKPICDEKTIEAVSALFAAKGSNAWFDTEAADILPAGYACPFCGGKHFTKEGNTLDGWFDSGSSHFYVLEGRLGNYFPADLYLEGADQYRGWFQSSLLTAVGAKGQGAPYRTVLTHGWVVDGEGKAMHKSLGNSVAPEEMIAKYGADLVRLWVASSDYRVDVRASDAIFRQLSDAYRKIRNTARFLLADLYDFNPDTDLLPPEEWLPLDRWAVAMMNDLVREARQAYDDYEFHLIYHGINNFCTVDLSKLYIDITKDRVYAEAGNSKERRSAQSAMYLIIHALTRLMAPLLAFTAEEIWQAMPHRAGDVRESVFLNDLPEYEESLSFPAEKDRYEKFFLLRDPVMKALELARADKKIGKSLDAALTLYVPGEEDYQLLSSFGEELPALFIVSDVKLVKGGIPAELKTTDEAPLGALVKNAEGEKCDRCWNYTRTPFHDADGGCLCPRCRRVLGL